MTDGPLDGRVAVVSGAGKGLGRAFARQLASLGARVLVNNRNRTVDDDGYGPADHVVDEITAAGGVALADYTDASARDSGDLIVAAALAAWGRLDICVVNAAVGPAAMFHRQPAEDFDAVLAINLDGAVSLARAAVRHMREAGFGRVVLVSSTGGLYGDVGLSAYAASKGALLALGRTLAAEGARRGVLTNVLLPYAATQMTDSGLTDDLRRRMDPAPVARVVGALADERCRLNGEYVVCGGDRLRVATPVEWGTVSVPEGAVLSAAGLEDLVRASRAGVPHEFRTATEAFADLMGVVAAEPVGSHQ